MSDTSHFCRVFNSQTFEPTREFGLADFFFVTCFLRPRSIVLENFPRWSATPNRGPNASLAEEQRNVVLLGQPGVLGFFHCRRHRVVTLALQSLCSLERAHKGALGSLLGKRLVEAWDDSVGGYCDVEWDCQESTAKSETEILSSREGVHTEYIRKLGFERERLTTNLTGVDGFSGDHSFEGRCVPQLFRLHVVDRV